MRRSWRGLLVGVTAVLGTMNLGGYGCGPDDPEVEPTQFCTGEPAPANGEPAVVLGRMVGTTFTPIVAGDVLTLESGSQGGQHFYFALRVYTPQALETSYQLDYIDDASMMIGGSAERGFDACAPGWVQTVDDRLVVYSGGQGTGMLSLDVLRDGEPDPALHVEVRIGLTDR